MPNYSSYDAAGRITGVFTGPFSPADPKMLPQCVEGAYHWSIYYVLDGVPTLRPTQATTVNGLVLSNLPPSGTIKIDGVEYPYSGESVELELLPGKYSIEVVSFPFLDFKCEVTA